MRVLRRDDPGKSNEITTLLTSTRAGLLERKMVSLTIIDYGSCDLHDVAYRVRCEVAEETHDSE